MKTTVLSEEGNMQLVLTPESEFEKDIIEKYGKDFSNVQIFKGSFYDCQGGWTRQNQYKDSLMLRIRDDKKV